MGYYVGQTDKFVQKIPIKDIVQEAGYASATALSVTAICRAAVRIMTRAVKGSKGNLWTFAGITLVSVAGYIFSDKLVAKLGDYEYVTVTIYATYKSHTVVTPGSQMVTEKLGWVVTDFKYVFS